MFAEGRGDLFTNGGDESSTMGVDGELTGVVCEWDDCGGMFSDFGGVCDEGNGVGVSGNDPGGGGERYRSTGDLSYGAGGTGAVTVGDGDNGGGEFGVDGFEDDGVTGFDDDGDDDFEGDDVGVVAAFGDDDPVEDPPHFCSLQSTW